eukprot:GEMP01064712.1.p1 GENE.GEMP01064712.1~~GEMP01064712.1.p1  ORF type:complete len:347 (+),score=104.79 GEMP01064712.1:96-1136(+)
MWAQTPFSTGLNLGQAQLGSFQAQVPMQFPPGAQVPGYPIAGQRGGAFPYQQTQATQGLQKIPQQQVSQPKGQSLDMPPQQVQQQQQQQQHGAPSLGQFHHLAQPQQFQQPPSAPQQTFHPLSAPPQSVAQEPPQLHREVLRDSVSRQSHVLQPFPNQQQPTAQVQNHTLERHSGHSGHSGQMANGNLGDKKREMQLEKRVHDLELQLRHKDAIIQNLQSELKKSGVNMKVISQKSKPSTGSPTSKPQANVIDAKPLVPYTAVNRNDNIDVRLEEFYNSTNSAIQFERINRGWYKFGKTLVELELINHKLMAKTDEGWNRGKHGDVEKFLVTFEPIEREAAGIPFE